MVFNPNLETLVPYAHARRPASCHSTILAHSEPEANSHLTLKWVRSTKIKIPEGDCLMHMNVFPQSQEKPHHPGLLAHLSKAELVLGDKPSIDIQLQVAGGPRINTQIAHRAAASFDTDSTLAPCPVKRCACRQSRRAPDQLQSPAGGQHP